MRDKEKCTCIPYWEPVTRAGCPKHDPQPKEREVMPKEDTRWWENEFKRVAAEAALSSNPRLAIEMVNVVAFIKEIEDRKEKEAYQKGREEGCQECIPDLNRHKYAAVRAVAHLSNLEKKQNELLAGKD